MSENTIEKSPKQYDFQSIYNPEKIDLKIKVESHDYSNLAYINVSYRDIMIDFLKMPGTVTDDGKTVVPANRIYMSHSAAKSLAESILKTLDEAYDSGQLEQYSKG